MEITIPIHSRGSGLLFIYALFSLIWRTDIEQSVKAPNSLLVVIYKSVKKVGYLNLCEFNFHNNVCLIGFYFLLIRILR